MELVNNTDKRNCVGISAATNSGVQLTGNDHQHSGTSGMVGCSEVLDAQDEHGKENGPTVCLSGGIRENHVPPTDLGVQNICGAGLDACGKAPQHGEGEGGGLDPSRRGKSKRGVGRCENQQESRSVHNALGYEEGVVPDHKGMVEYKAEHGAVIPVTSGDVDVSAAQGAAECHDNRKSQSVEKGRVNSPSGERRADQRADGIQWPHESCYPDAVSGQRIARRSCGFVSTVGSGVAVERRGPTPAHAGVLNNCGDNALYGCASTWQYGSKRVHRNLGCPSSAEFDFAKDTANWPIHAKELPLINLTALMDLATNTGIEHWRQAAKWLTSEEPYANVIASKPGKFFFGAPQRAELIAKQYMTLASELPTGGFSNVFGHVETEKKRIRVLQHSYDVNNSTEPDRKIKLANVFDVQAITKHGKYALCFDMSQFFGQFPLSRQTRRFFRFRIGKKTYEWTRLAMGQRQSCDVAQTALETLTANLATVRIRYIDNIIFVDDSPEKIVQEALVFLKRCKDVGATVNEVDCNRYTEAGETLLMLKNDIASMVVTSTEFLGMHLDFTGKTKALSKKTIRKLKEAWENRAAWRVRHFSSFVSLLFYACTVHGCQLYDRYSVLREWSQTHSQIARRPQDQQDAAWDDAFTTTDKVWHGLQVWYEHEMQNTPVGCSYEKTQSLFDSVVISDASGTGWAGIAMMPSGEVLHATGQWGSDEDKGSSSTSEPWGLLAALRALGTPWGSRVLVLSDNTTLVAAINNGRSWSWHANRVGELMSDRSEMSLTCTARHVPGLSNTADSGSRGAVIDLVAAAKQARQALQDNGFQMVNHYP